MSVRGSEADKRETTTRLVRLDWEIIFWLAAMAAGLAYVSSARPMRHADWTYDLAERRGT